MIKILTKREKTILYATIGIVIFAIAFNFLIAPILTRNENLNKEISLTKVKLKKYLRLLSQKDYLQNKYNKFSAPLKSLPGEPEVFVSALSELENLAEAANVQIIDIRPQVPKSLGLYRETIIDLRTEGTMEGHLKFIYDLESSLLLLRIKRFHLTTKPDTSALEGSFSISQLSIE